MGESVMTEFFNIFLNGQGPMAQGFNSGKELEIFILS